MATNKYTAGAWPEGLQPGGMVMQVTGPRLSGGLLAFGLAAAASLSMAAPTDATGTKAVGIVNGGTTGFHYMPANVKVASATTVTWTNKSVASHTVSRCTVSACGVSGGTGTDTGFGSAVVGPQGKYSFSFHGKGTYVYYCQVHGYATMHGKVTIT